MGVIYDQLKLKKKELEKYRDSIRTLENEIYQLNRRLISENVSEKINAYEIKKLDYPNGLNRLFIRDFLCYEKKSDFIGLLEKKLLLHGCGPWKKIEFEEFLSKKEFDCVGQDINPNILILGDLNLDTKEIDRILLSKKYLTKDLRIYTQELFVYYLITGEDPLEAWETDSLLSAVEGHAGLQYILNFPNWVWPNSYSNPENAYYEVSEIDPSDWDEESPLRKLGYTVKEGALSDEKRHKLLTRAFSESLDEYLNNNFEKNRWGKANSAQRLYAIASFIRWLNGFQGSNKPGASTRWKNDLQWLKNEFYVRRMNFIWPSPVIENNWTNKRINKSISMVNKRPKMLTKVEFFKVGQKVFHEKFGWGKVTEISSGRDQVEVNFSGSSEGGLRIFNISIAKFYQ